MSSRLNNLSGLMIVVVFLIGVLIPSVDDALSAEGDLKGKSVEGSYIIKKGDTLWGISSSYLHDPFLWPKLWKENKFITNPDLIHPGDILMLPHDEGLTEVLSSEQATQAAREEVPVTKPEKAEKAEEAEEAEEVPPIPEEKEVPPLELEPAFLASSGYILSGMKSSGVVIGSEDGRGLLGEGDLIYLLPGDGVTPLVGERFTLYRMMRKVFHPKILTKENKRVYLGDLIRILGTLQVMEVGEKMVTATILQSYDFILKGDQVMSFQPKEISAELEGRAAPTEGLKGYIVETKEERTTNAQFDVVYIDKGKQDGVKTGDSFRVIREGEKTSLFSPGRGIRLPNRVIGELQVISVQEMTATTRVIRSSEVILKGDLTESSIENQ